MSLELCNSILFYDSLSSPLLVVVWVVCIGTLEELIQRAKFHTAVSLLEKSGMTSQPS